MKSGRETKCSLQLFWLNAILEIIANPFRWKWMHSGINDMWVNKENKKVLIWKYKILSQKSNSLWSHGL